MPYSVWSRGRLVGHTDLEFAFRRNGFRMGWFHPTEAGEKLMPIATGISPALHAASDAGRNILRDPDVISAFDYAYALELELRGPDGKKIETMHITITDTEFLASIAYSPDEFANDEQLDREQEPASVVESEDEVDWLFDDRADEPWREPGELPRYQILIFLADESASTAR